MSYGDRVTAVEGVDEFRRHLGDVLRSFRADAAHARPVIFGNHRRPEAAVVPYQRLVELEDAEQRAEDLALALLAAQRRESPIVGTVADFFVAAGLDPVVHAVDGE